MLCLMKSDTGDNVIKLQHLLNHCLAGPQLVVDGEFSTPTYKAVIRFQNKSGLQIDGVVGPVTLTALVKVAMPALFKDEMPSWIKVAWGEIGQVELAGSSHNPRIIEYLKTCSNAFSEDEIPWCSAFGKWCMKQAEIDTNGVDAMARSWTRFDTAMKHLRPGAPTVFWRVDPKASTGHFAFALFGDDEMIACLGGNQRNSVCVQFYPTYRLLSYRWPIKRLNAVRHTEQLNTERRENG